MSLGPNRNNSSAPKVVMDELVFQKIMYWVNKSHNEVSGLGTVVMESPRLIRVTDVMLLEQRNTAATTEIDGAALGMAAYEFHKNSSPGEMKFWWHSHVNMAVFWSGQDMETIVNLAQGGWFVSMVINKRRETRTCISMNDPFSIVYDEVALEVERMLPADLVASWDAEYTKKVTNFVPKFKAGTSGRTGGSSSHHHQHPQHQSSRKKKHQPHLSLQKPRREVFPPLSQAEKEEIARMAELMTDEDPKLGSFFTDDQPDFSGYGDLDWPGSQSLHQDPQTKQLNVIETSIEDVFNKRDMLEEKVCKYEDRILTLKENGKEVPENLMRAMEEAEMDLNDVEEELDTLEQAGIITEDERLNRPSFGGNHGH